MMLVTMHEFIAFNRNELIRRRRAKAVSRFESPAPENESDRGIPPFLDQIIDELSRGSRKGQEIEAGAVRHGRRSFSQGLTVSQVVHDYGDVFQAVTDLTVEVKAPINADDFRTLNRCLDDAIASAVSAYALQQRIESNAQAQWKSLTLRNLLFIASTAFEILQSGNVGIAGTTAVLVRQSFEAMQALICSCNWSRAYMVMTCHPTRTSSLVSRRWPMSRIGRLALLSSRAQTIEYVNTIAKQHSL